MESEPGRSGNFRAMNYFGFINVSFIVFISIKLDKFW